MNRKQIPKFKRKMSASNELRNIWKGIITETKRWLGLNTTG